MQLPGPVRAVIGLAANVADEARHLPDRAIELPMLAVSSALQISLRAQQRYARLAARGDQVLGGVRTTDEPPAWATFDDPVPADELRSLAREQLGDSPDATELLDELFGAEETELTPPTPITAAKKAPRKAGRKATGKTAGAAKPATAKPAVAAKKSSPPPPGKKQAKKSGKSVNKPRHTAPSKFDDADDD